MTPRGGGGGFGGGAGSDRDPNAPIDARAPEPDLHVRREPVLGTESAARPQTTLITWS